MENETNIKEIFALLKHHEEGAAPAFSRVWNAAASKMRATSKRSGNFYVVASSALLVVGALATVFLVNDQGQPRQDDSISNWHSPTDILLRSSDSFLWSTPRLGEMFFQIESDTNNKQMEKL